MLLLLVSILAAVFLIFGALIYLRLKAQRLPPNSPNLFIGENRDLSFNLLQRIDQIINCKPDFVILFIGVKEVHASLNKNEALSHINAKRTGEFSQKIREIAEKMGTAYLSIHESMIAFLQENPSRPKYSYEN